MTRFLRGISVVWGRLLSDILVVHNRLPQSQRHSFPPPARRLALSLKMYPIHFFNALSRNDVFYWALGWRNYDLKKIVLLFGENYFKQIFVLISNR